MILLASQVLGAIESWSNTLFPPYNTVYSQCLGMIGQQNIDDRAFPTFASPLFNESLYALTQQALRQRAWHPLQSLVTGDTPLDPLDSGKTVAAVFPFQTAQWSEEHGASGTGVWHHIPHPRVCDLEVFAILFDQSPHGMTWSYVHSELPSA